MAEDDFNSGMHIEIGSISANGHVVFSSGDSHVSGNTRDDVVSNQTITVGGVKTTPQAFESLKKSLTEVDKAIDESKLPEDDNEAARENAKVLKSQLTSKNKPNSVLLTQAADQLTRFGPKIAGTVVSVFTNPLAGEIVEMAGERALKFYKKLRAENSSLFTSSS